MLWVGLTGGTGSGKSTVAADLARRGAVVVDADVLARQVVEPGTAALAAIAAEFGPHLILPDGTLDRAGLAAVVFADQQALRTLEAITHPAIRAATTRARRAAPDDAVVIHDMPLIVEGGTAPEHHLVVVVDAPVEVRVRRLAGRGMPPDDARRRIAAQATTQQRRAVADVWLDNSGAPEELTGELDRLWTRLTGYEQRLRTGRVGTPDGAEPDAASLDRVRARVRHSLGDPALELGAGDGCPLSLPGRVAAELGPVELRRRLAAAGLVPVGPGRYSCADPGLPACLVLAPGDR